MKQLTVEDEREHSPSSTSFPATENYLRKQALFLFVIILLLGPVSILQAGDTSSDTERDSLHILTPGHFNKAIELPPPVFIG